MVPESSVIAQCLYGSKKYVFHGINYYLGCWNFLSLNRQTTGFIISKGGNMIKFILFYAAYQL